MADSKVSAAMVGSMTGTVERDTMAPPSLSVSIVTYRPDRTELERTLTSLALAASHLAGPVAITIIDNSSPSDLAPRIAQGFAGLPVSVIAGQGNVGYGRANNLVLDRLGRFHLVLNPDVEMAPDALAQALHFMEAHPDCGLLTPFAEGRDGQRQFLCKRYPALVDLALRGFAPAGLRRLFRRRLDHYQMADMSPDAVSWDPPIVSGCFMLFRSEVLRALKGFDPDYFLYFEDFDLSLRAGRMTRIAYVPQVRIVHGGGNAGAKGFWHIRQFARSALTFYRKFGWRIV
ncbi:glycosyltransferase family 2 protein [Rhizobium straminoryzae]|nr:glycosyltransferase family 2 protein [Rhizobium straminoryzae]